MPDQTPAEHSTPSAIAVFFLPLHYNRKKREALQAVKFDPWPQKTGITLFLLGELVAALRIDDPATSKRQVAAYTHAWDEANDIEAGVVIACTPDERQFFIVK